MFSSAKNKCFWQEVWDSPNYRFSPCQVPTVLLSIGDEQVAFIIWVKAGCDVGSLGILALRKQNCRFPFIKTLPGDSVWLQCWQREGSSKSEPCDLPCTPGAAPPRAQHQEGLQQGDGGCAAKRSPWCLLCTPDISVSQLRRLKVRKGMGHYLISFPDFLLLFWAIYTLKNAKGKQSLFSLMWECLSFALLNHKGKHGVISLRFSARTRESSPNAFHGLSVWVSVLLAVSGEESINA